MANTVKELHQPLKRSLSKNVSSKTMDISPVVTPRGSMSYGDTSITSTSSVDFGAKSSTARVSLLLLAFGGGSCMEDRDCSGAKNSTPPPLPPRNAGSTPPPLPPRNMGSTPPPLPPRNMGSTPPPLPPRPTSYPASSVPSVGIVYLETKDIKMSHKALIAICKGCRKVVKKGKGAVEWMNDVRTDPRTRETLQACLDFLGALQEFA